MSKRRKLRRITLEKGGSIIPVELVESVDPGWLDRVLWFLFVAYGRLVGRLKRLGEVKRLGPEDRERLVVDYRSRCRFEGKFPYLVLNGSRVFLVRKGKRKEIDPKRLAGDREIVDSLVRYGVYPPNGPN